MNIRSKSHTPHLYAYIYQGNKTKKKRIEEKSKKFAFTNFNPFIIEYSDNLIYVKLMPSRSFYNPHLIKFTLNLFETYRNPHIYLCK